VAGRPHPDPLPAALVPRPGCSCAGPPRQRNLSPASAGPACAAGWLSPTCLTSAEVAPVTAPDIPNSHPLPTYSSSLLLCAGACFSANAMVYFKIGFCVLGFLAAPFFNLVGADLLFQPRLFLQRRLSSWKSRPLT
jgi:hypothetical protein